MDKNCCITKSGEYRAQGDKTTSGFYTHVPADATFFGSFIRWYLGLVLTPVSDVIRVNH
jgi:hypothetical protein